MQTTYMKHQYQRFNRKLKRPARGNKVFTEKEYICKFPEL